MADTYTSRTLRELVRIVASRFLGMVIIFAIIVGAVTAASLYAPKWYRSEVQMMASPARVSNPLAGRATSQREDVSLFVMTQREIILSESVLGAALMMLDNPNYAPKARLAKDTGYTLPAQLLKELPKFIADNTDQLRRFRKRVTVLTPGGPDATFTQTFKIMVDWPETRKEGNGPREQRRLQAAEDCQKLADYLVQAYLARYQQLEAKRTEAARTFLEKKGLAEAEQRVDEAKTALEAEAAKLGADLLPVASIVGKQGIDSGAARLVTELESSINTVEAHLAQLSAMRSTIEKQLAAAETDPSAMAVPDEVTSGNPVISQIQQQIADLEMKLNSLVPRYTGKYLEVETTKKELSEAYADLVREMRKQLERVTASIEIKQAERTNLAARLAKFSKDMQRIGPQAIRYSRLQEALQAAIDNYNEQEKDYLESVRAENLARDPVLVSVVDAASRPDPDQPRRPILWLNILIACVGGLILALVYAFLADHFDHTIKSVDEAERYLGAPVVASVPKLGRRIIQAR
ncbi:MAG: hypothetical protein JW849_03335 [Phycisphaerae bacterium]|nr:hypothetical protein [Phycisphaerae bacterium]